MRPLKTIVSSLVTTREMVLPFASLRSVRDIQIVSFRGGAEGLTLLVDGELARPLAARA